MYNKNTTYLNYVKQLPEFPRFTKLSLEHKIIFDTFINVFDMPYSDFTFCSLWCWNTKDKFGLAQLNNNIIIKFSDYITNQNHLTILGIFDLDLTIKYLRKYLSRHKFFIPYIKLIPNFFLSYIKLKSAITIIEDYANHDYIYSLNDLYSLSGRKYASRRNNISKVKRLKSSYAVSTIDISDDKVWENIKSINEIWLEKQLHSGNTAYNDVQAIDRIRILSKYLLCTGFFHNGNLLAYNINEFPNNQYAISMFEHSVPDYSFCLTFLQKETAKILIDQGFIYWNWQQDLGLENLRNSKLLSHPLGYAKKYIIF